LKEQLRAPVLMRAGVAVAAMGLVVIDFFPRPVAMSAVMQRPVDAWLSKQPGDFAFMEYPIPRHGYGGPAIYSTRLTGKRIIMGSSQNPPNLAYWSDLSAFPSPTTIDLLAGWGAKYVLVDENLYRAGSSSWNIYQTWNTLESAIKLNPRLKEVTVLDGVHIYQIDSGTGDIGRELLINGSFEQASTARVHGWQLVGKPTIDHTGKYSAGGNAAYNVTGKDFLLSAPIPVDSGQCYRLSARQMANSSKPGTLRLQVDWKDEHKRDLRVPTIVADDVRSIGRSRVWWFERRPEAGTLSSTQRQPPERSGLMIIPLRRFLVIANRYSLLPRIRFRYQLDNQDVRLSHGMSVATPKLV